MGDISRTWKVKQILELFGHSGRNTGQLLRRQPATATADSCRWDLRPKPEEDAWASRRRLARTRDWKANCTAPRHLSDLSITRATGTPIPGL